MTRIAIAGAAGRMGRNLVVACDRAEGLELSLAVEMAGKTAAAWPDLPMEMVLTLRTVVGSVG